MRNTIGKILIVILLPLSACIERLDVSVVPEDSFVLVSANVTDDQAANVNISILSGEQETLVNGASVMIIDNLGNEFTLDHQGSGEYTTENSIGVVGRSYSLKIALDNGSTYSSTFEEIVPVPEVDTFFIDTATEVVLNDSGNEEIVERWQILVRTQTINEEGTYLRWKYTGLAQVFYNADLPCWFNHDGPENFLNVFGSDELRAGEAIDHTLIILGSNGIYENYNLFLRQMSLNPNAFRYWSSIQQQRENTVGFFEEQPANIVGNIQNDTNPDEVVLGYFTVSSVARKTFVFNKFKIPILLDNAALDIWPADCFEGPPPLSCFDCRAVGGVSAVPPNWIFP
ncbi:MAG: DUF4249 domain-containing protein [Bacteroidota bacterium]